MPQELIDRLLRRDVKKSIDSSVEEKPESIEHSADADTKPEDSETVKLSEEPSDAEEETSIHLTSDATSVAAPDDKTVLTSEDASESMPESDGGSETTDGSEIEETPQQDAIQGYSEDHIPEHMEL